MNVFVYLLFGAGLVLGVLNGHPNRSLYNKYDEMAVGMIIAAFIFAVVDTYLTVSSFVSGL